MVWLKGEFQNWAVTRRPNELLIEKSLKEGQISKFGPSFRDFVDNSPVKCVSVMSEIYLKSRSIDGAV